MPVEEPLVAGIGQGKAHLASDNDNEATAVVLDFFCEGSMCSKHLTYVTSYTFYQNLTRKMLLLSWCHK